MNWVKIAESIIVHASFLRLKVNRTWRPREREREEGDDELDGRELRFFFLIGRVNDLITNF